MSDKPGSDAATSLGSVMQDVPKNDDKKKSKPQIDTTKFTVRIEVKMPEMGAGGGKIIKWYKSPGDLVKHEDVLCDIETPDFTFGMETDDENLAIMGEIFVEAPSGNVKDDAVICVLLHEETDETRARVDAEDVEKEEYDDDDEDEKEDEEDHDRNKRP
jgi:pyruvate/2-oxoglutarate dehydrogenase complex dihydrolipoamide acyltransferase (E2) component